jgi:hypothetical protein
MHPATIFYSRLVVGSAVEPSRDGGERIVIGLREVPQGAISWCCSWCKHQSMCKYARPFCMMRRNNFGAGNECLFGLDQQRNLYRVEGREIIE